MRDSESHLFCKPGHPVTLSIRRKQQTHTHTIIQGPFWCKIWTSNDNSLVEQQASNGHGQGGGCTPGTEAREKHYCSMNYGITKQAWQTENEDLDQIWGQVILTIGSFLQHFLSSLRVHWAKGTKCLGSGNTERCM